MARLTEWKDGVAVSIGKEIEEDYYSEREKLARYEDIGEPEELVKVVKAEWVEIEEDLVMVMCSNCDLLIDNISNYCSSCGAEMAQYVAAKEC